MPIVFRSCLLLVLTFGAHLLPPLLPAVDARFVAERRQKREYRQRLRTQAAEDQMRRAETAAGVIAELIDYAREHRVAGQDAQLVQMLVGLERLDPRQVTSLQAELDDLPAEPTDIDRSRARRWERERIKQLKKLLGRTGDLLNKSIDLGLTDLSHQFLTEILTFDPDRGPLRKGLGQRQYEGRWLQPFAYDMARQGLVWDDNQAWIAPAAEERYRTGQVYDLQRKTWTTATEADAFHSDPNHPWIIRTEHLELHGTAPLAVMADAGTRLESFYARLFAAYANFFTIDKNSYKLILGMAEHPPLRVHIYKNKAHYQQALPSAPSWSAGLFHSGSKASYFYGKVSSVMYHEFTHQTLYIFSRGCEAPVWLVEGIAVYTESPSYDDFGDLVLGDLSRNAHVRGHLAAYAKGRHMALDELMALTHERWSAASDPARQYHAAGALTQFCMEANDRAWRADFVDFLRDSYHGKERAQLWDYLGLGRGDFHERFQAWCAAGGKSPDDD